MLSAKQRREGPVSIEVKVWLEFKLQAPSTWFAAMRWVELSYIP